MEARSDFESSKISMRINTAIVPEDGKIQYKKLCVVTLVCFNLDMFFL